MTINRATKNNCNLEGLRGVAFTIGSK